MAEPALAFRSVFVSDIHLGSAGGMTDEFQHFLHGFRCEYLYLVGDLIDVWLVMKSGKWQQQHTNVIRTILGKSKHGTIVRYTPGNHDACLRRVNGSELGNITIDHSFVHVANDGKRYLVVHGDLFDGSVTKMQWLAWIGAWAYEILFILNGRWNKRRERGDKEPVDFVTVLKKRLKRVVKKLTSYEESLVQHAEDNDFDGVVCGHIHRPALVQHENGLLYANTGDWVENGTCIVEHFDGKLELLYWDAARRTVSAQPTHSAQRKPAVVEVR